MRGAGGSDARRRLRGVLEVAGGPASCSLSADSEVVVYGAGGCGRDALSELARQGFRVVGMLDANRKAVPPVQGLDCFLPDSPTARRWAAEGLPVVIAVFNYAADAGLISERLREVGFRHIVSYYELAEWFPRLRRRFWLGPRRLYQESAPRIEECLNLWSDDLSRSIFLDAIELRVAFDLNLLRSPDRSHQYFPQDIPALRQPLRMVDGGAYVGDTLKHLVDNGFDFSAVACFEPDPRNFQHLCRYVSGAPRTFPESVLFPCGLGDTTSAQRFSSGLGEGSLVCPEGESVVQVVALDDVLPTFAPTLIKLDVEGAEPAALLGARRTIARQGPDLAVCLYHSASHLWELPLLIRALRTDYAMFLRYHQFNALEMVVYAFVR